MLIYLSQEVVVQPLHSLFTGYYLRDSKPNSNDVHERVKPGTFTEPKPLHKQHTHFSLTLTVR